MMMMVICLQVVAVMMMMIALSSFTLTRDAGRVDDDTSILKIVDDIVKRRSSIAITNVSFLSVATMNYK